MRVAAGCREYNVEGRLELGTGNTQTHTKQGSSTAPLSLIMLLLQNGCWDFYHFINKLEKEAKSGKIKEKEGWANIGLSTPTHSEGDTPMNFSLFFFKWTASFLST